VLSATTGTEVYKSYLQHLQHHILGHYCEGTLKVLFRLCCQTLQTMKNKSLWLLTMLLEVK
jgi:hypothetical protein